MSRFSLMKNDTTNAIATIGSAARNTSLKEEENASITLSRTGGGSEAILLVSLVSMPASATALPNATVRWWSRRLLRIAPNNAVPKVPPRARKNVTELVAAPM